MFSKLETPDKLSSVISIKYSPLIPATDQTALRAHKQSGIIAIILQEILSHSEILPRGIR